jgi:hypothetical protein
MTESEIKQQVLLLLHLNQRVSELLPFVDMSDLSIASIASRLCLARRYLFFRTKRNFIKRSCANSITVGSEKPVLRLNRGTFAGM